MRGHFKHNIYDDWTRRSKLVLLLACIIGRILIIPVCTCTLLHSVRHLFHHHHHRRRRCHHHHYYHHLLNLYMYFMVASVQRARDPKRTGACVQHACIAVERWKSWKMFRGLVTPPPLAMFDSQWALELPCTEH